MEYKKIAKLMDDNYDKSYEKIKKTITNLDEKQNYTYNYIDDNVIEILFKDKLVLKGEYCVLGLYNIQLSLWYWSWNIAFINKKLTKKPISNIKNYIDVINKNYDKFNVVDVEMLHYLLSNDNFYISNDNINKLIKLGLYLTKCAWFFPIKQYDGNDNVIQYILITKILQY